MGLGLVRVRVRVRVGVRVRVRVRVRCLLIRGVVRVDPRPTLGLEQQLAPASVEHLG